MRHTLDMSVRLFEPIDIGNNKYFSIQASWGHYCTPRSTLLDLEEYTHWEVAFFEEGGSFLPIESILPNFPSLAEIEHYFEGSVYPYVPKDLVEELYLALK